MPFLWCALIVGFVVTLWAKAGMYFVATLGPLFIALAMFDQTRKYLHNWLDQIVTMIALQVLVALTCGLVIQGLEKAVKTAPTPESVFALAGHVIVLAVFSLAIWSSLPRLASKLGGYGASLAGAGSRAAPFETARAAIGSFNEHGSPPPGRPELATISPRGGDSHAASAPIVPPPVVSGDGGRGPASGSPSSSAPGPARETETATRPHVASTTGTFASGHDARPMVVPVSAPMVGTAAAAPIGGTAASTTSSGFVAANTVSVASTSLRETPLRASPDLGVATATSATASARSHTAMPDPEFEEMLGEQRTGFEGMEFEGAAPRPSDSRSIASAAPLPAAPGRTEEASTADPVDANPTIISATDRRSS